MFLIACIAILVIMLLIVVRAFYGPTVYDRILAVNVFGTHAILLIALYGYLTNRPEFLDLAIVYTLINFTGVLSVLKFIDKLNKFNEEGESV